MPYLENIPKEATDYGLNKLLTVRSLSIDWKHRDSEINLRNTGFLDNLLQEGFSLRKIYETRANQLRFINHLPRSVFKFNDLNNMICTFSLLNNQGFHNFPGNIFIDFDCIKNNEKPFDKNLLLSSNIFSLKMKQKDIIQYFLSNKLPIPKNILMVKNLKDLKVYFDKNISLIFYEENTFKELDLKYLWICNYHLFKMYSTGHCSRLSFKTDSKLQLPIIL